MAQFICSHWGSYTFPFRFCSEWNMLRNGLQCPWIMKHVRHLQFMIMFNAHFIWFYIVITNSYFVSYVNNVECWEWAMNTWTTEQLNNWTDDSCMNGIWEKSNCFFVAKINFGNLPTPTTTIKQHTLHKIFKFVICTKWNHWLNKSLSSVIKCLLSFDHGVYTLTVCCVPCYMTMDHSSFVVHFVFHKS